MPVNEFMGSLHYNSGAGRHFSLSDDFRNERTAVEPDAAAVRHNGKFRTNGLVYLHTGIPLYRLSLPGFSKSAKSTAPAKKKRGNQIRRGPLSAAVFNALDYPDRDG